MFYGVMIGTSVSRKGYGEVGYTKNYEELYPSKALPCYQGRGLFKAMPCGTHDAHRNANHRCLLVQPIHLGRTMPLCSACQKIHFKEKVAHTKSFGRASSKARRVWGSAPKCPNSVRSAGEGLRGEPSPGFSHVAISGICFMPVAKPLSRQPAHNPIVLRLPAQPKVLAGR